jgi:hypothetical protein
MNTQEPPVAQPTQTETDRAAFVVQDTALKPGSRTLDRLNHLFRRSLMAGRIHPLYAALGHMRGHTP